jgi:hypothetical protein
MDNKQLKSDGSNDNCRVLSRCAVVGLRAWRGSLSPTECIQYILSFIAYLSCGFGIYTLSSDNNASSVLFLSMFIKFFAFISLFFTISSSSVFLCACV